MYSSRLELLLSFSVLTGKSPSAHDLSRMLRVLKRRDVVLSLAWLLAVTEAWKHHSDNATDVRVREVIMPNWTNRLRKFSNGFLFSRHSLLWLVRQAILLCPAEGEAVANGSNLETLGVACLVANDLTS